LIVREADRCDLAVGEGKTDMLFDPRQGLIRVDPGPWERTVRQSRQSLRDDALRAMQAGQKNTRRFPNPVGNHHALLQFEIDLAQSVRRCLDDIEYLLAEGAHELLRTDAPPPEKISGASRRGSLTFCNNFAVCSFRCKDRKTLTISTPSLRLGGKASGQPLTEIGRIMPCGSRPQAGL
jgi:hypothetical protein